MTSLFARSADRTRRTVALSFAVLTALAVSFATRTVTAEEKTRSAAPVRAPPRAMYSDYEQETINLVKAERHAHIDAAPEGKWIEAIDVVTLDVIEPRDPASRFLSWLNWFHATTRESIVRREVLLAPGQRYEQRLVDESERNLRAIRQLSLVLIIPVRGSHPDRVKLLVITKDIWTLRLNSNFRITNGQLEFLFLQPSEENLLGRHYSVSAQYLLEPDTQSIGVRWANRRLGGSRIETLASGNVILNRNTGRTEGSFGDFFYGQPLFSTQTEWAWGTELQWRNEVTRLFRGLDQVRFDADATPRSDRLVFGPVVIAETGIPYEYDTQLLFWQTSVTRSFGYRNKTDLRWGLEANRRAFSTERLARFDPIAVREFTDEEVPTSDTRIGPFAQLNAYSADYIQVLDVETLGLQEDIQLGHSLFLKAYPAAKVASSSRDLLGMAAGLAYTVPLGRGFMRAYGTSRIELAGTESQSDARVETGVRLVTPSFAIARLVYEGALLHRYLNYLNARTTLGGDTRLRGYASSAFRGKDVIASNVELRSRGVSLWTLQLGAVAFYDSGDAFDGFDDLNMKHGVGFGFRAVVPQLQRVVGRLDVAFPLSRVSRLEAPSPVNIVLTLEGQAFDLPVISPLSTVLPP